MAGLAKSSVPSASKSATASSSDSVGVEPAAEAPATAAAIGGEPGADGVEEIAELAELVALRQIHDHVELAAAQARQAAADDVNGAQRQLCRAASRRGCRR